MTFDDVPALLATALNHVSANTAALLATLLAAISVALLFESGRILRGRRRSEWGTPFSLWSMIALAIPALPTEALLVFVVNLDGVRGPIAYVVWIWVGVVFVVDSLVLALLYAVKEGFKS